MRIRKILFLLLRAMVPTMAMLLSTTLVFAQDVVPARPADTFVESIGVNVHFGYTDTKYVQEYETVRNKLQALGIRYVRSKAMDPNGWKTPYSLYLYNQTGIQILALVSHRDGGYPNPLDTEPAAMDSTLDVIVNHYNNDGRQGVIGLEGPNEYDISHGDDPDWVNTLRTFQELLYDKAEARSELAELPVLSPSIVWSVDEVGEFGTMSDAINMHPYPGGKKPTKNLDYNFNKYQPMAPEEDEFWATETGYHNALNGGGYLGQPGVPEEVEARYLPRLYMEYFRRDIEKTFSYELIDLFADPDNNNQEHNFGLLRNDLSEKPVFSSLQNTIALLEDPGTSFSPGTLEYELTGETDDVHEVLLQKRDGKFFLVLWQSVSNYDIPQDWESGGEGQILDPPTASVGLSLGEPVEHVRTYLPLNSTQSTGTYDSPTEVSLEIPGHLLVIEIEPQRIQQQISLQKGWNLISSYVRPDPSQLDSVFADVMAELVRVKSDTGGHFVPDQDTNTISHWKSDEAYAVYVQSGTTLTLEGTALDLSRSISLQQGWNSVPFLPRNPTSVSHAFSSISSELVLVKDMYGRTYYPAKGINDIGKLHPGLGYKVYVSDPTTLVYPAPPN